MHSRQIVRDAIYNTISGISSVNGAYMGNVYPQSTDDLPLLFVYAESDELLEREMGTTKQFRSSTVLIDVYDMASDNVDDSLDNICVDIESALMADYTLGIDIEDLYLTTYNVEYDDELEAPIAKGTLSYKAEYWLDSSNPTTIL